MPRRIHRTILLSIACFAGLMATAAFSSPALAASAQAKAKQIEALAKPLPETVIMFRWQSKASGDKLLEEKVFTDKLYSYFMSMNVDSAHFAAGRGIYASENPHSSSQFVRGDDEGSLIKVQIEKGTPFIDLSDPETQKKLTKLGLSSNDVLWTDPRVAVKYSAKDKWWVLKGQKGISFQKMDGSGLRPGYLLDIYGKLDGDKPRAIYARSIRSRIARIVTKYPGVLEKNGAVEVLREQGVGEVLKNLANSQDEDRIRSVIKVLRGSSSVAKLVRSSKALDTQISTLELRYAKISEMLEHLGPADPDGINRFLGTRFSTIKSEKDYIRQIGTLIEFVKNRPEFKVAIQSSAFQPSSGISLSAEGLQSANSMKDALLLSEKDAKEILGSASRYSIMSRLAVAKRLREVGKQSGFSSKFLADVESLFPLSKFSARDLNALSSLPLSQRVSRLQELLPYLKTGSDFVEFLNFNKSRSSSSEDRLVEGFIQKNADAILNLDSSGADVSKIMSWISSTDMDTYLKLVEKSVATAKSPKVVMGVLDLGNTKNSSYLIPISDIILRNAKTIMSTRPSAEEVGKLNEIVAIGGAWGFGDDQKTMKVKKNIQFLETVIENSRSLAPIMAIVNYHDHNNRMPDWIYRERVAKTLIKHVDELIAMPLSAKELEALSSSVAFKDSKILKAKFDMKVKFYTKFGTSAKQAQGNSQSASGNCVVNQVKRFASLFGK